MTGFTYDQVTAVYLKYRDEIAEADAAHKEAMKPRREAMEKMAAWLQSRLLAENLQNVRTESGTVYLKHDTSLKVVDQAALAAFAETQGFTEFFKTVVDTTAIKEYLEQGASRGFPPGIEPRETITAQVRRA